MNDQAPEIRHQPIREGLEAAITITTEQGDVWAGVLGRIRNVGGRFMGIASLLERWDPEKETGELEVALPDELEVVDGHIIITADESPDSGETPKHIVSKKLLLGMGITATAVSAVVAFRWNEQHKKK